MYEHAELPDEVLDIRAQELLAVIDITHGEERDAQIQRELAHIAFEQYHRYQEEKVKAWKPATMQNSKQQ
jgi:hypothetical protein